MLEITLHCSSAGKAANPQFIGQVLFSDPLKMNLEEFNIVNRILSRRQANQLSRIAIAATAFDYRSEPYIVKLQVVDGALQVSEMGGIMADNSWTATTVLKVYAKISDDSAAIYFVPQNVIDPYCGRCGSNVGPSEVHHLY